MLSCGRLEFTLNSCFMNLVNLTIGYIASNRKTVIRQNMDASLEKGKLTCLLGPNGAGKTTLLRTMAGFIPPLSGEILVGGKSISTLSHAEISKRISVVLTERPAVQNMTAEQLVSLGRSPFTGFWGRITDRDRSDVLKAMELTGTTHLKDRLVDTLSDGERQKVMIAKALAQSTDVILLDEPTAFLDFPGKAETMRLLSEIACRQNKSILLSTHDLNMAFAIGDNLWLMDKELGFSTGTPHLLAENGALEAYFCHKGVKLDKDRMMFVV